MRGICLDAENIPYGAPSMNVLSEFARPNGIGHRMVPFDTENFYWYHKELQQFGYETALVLTGQSFPWGVVDGGDLEWYCDRWAKTVKPSVWIWGNEWNIEGDASWPAGGDTAYVQSWQRAVGAIKAADPGARVYVGGLFSDPDPVGHLRRIWGRLTPTPDGIDYHPYTETLPQAENVLLQLRDAFGCEIGVFEWNDSNARAIPGFQAMLDRTTEHSNWFCWSDGMLPDHGLVTAGGRKHATYHALRDAYAQF